MHWISNDIVTRGVETQVVGWPYISSQEAEFISVEGVWLCFVESILGSFRKGRPTRTYLLHLHIIKKLVASHIQPLSL